MIELTYSASLTEGVSRYLREVERAALEEAPPKALTAVARKTRTRWIKYVRADVNLEAPLLRKTMRVFGARSNKWLASVWTETRPLSLRHFSPERTDRGVAVTILKARGRRVRAGSFLATMGNDRTGVFQRRFKSRKNPGARKGVARAIKTGKHAGKMYRPALPLDEQTIKGGVRGLAEGTRARAIAFAESITAREMDTARARAYKRHGLAA